MATRRTDEAVHGRVRIALETSVRPARVALRKSDGETVEKALDDGRAHASDLVPVIAELLEEHGESIDSLLASEFRRSAGQCGSLGVPNHSSTTLVVSPAASSVGTLRLVSTTSAWTLLGGNEVTSASQPHSVTRAVKNRNG